MRYLVLITPRMVVLLFLAGIGALPLGATAPSADSTRRIHLRDSLGTLQDRSRTRYLHTTASDDPFTVSADRFFCANSPALSEVAARSPLCVPVRYGLSNRFNRFLPYGTVAPIVSITQGGPLLFNPLDPFAGSDDRFTTELTALAFEPNLGARYEQQPDALVVPEASLYWENGVFNENVLAVRFARPLSRSLAVNAFSNYRSFAGMRFSHDGNGIYSFYKSLTPDTTTLVNRGYNPAQNDYASGFTAAWSGTHGSRSALSLTYADYKGELPLDQPPSFDIPAAATIDRYRTTLDLQSCAHRVGPLFMDLQGRLDASDLVLFPQRGTLVNRADAANDELWGAARLGTDPTKAFAAGLVYQGHQTRRAPFIREETRALDHRGTIEGSWSWRGGPVFGVLRGNAGALAIEALDSFDLAPTFGAALSLAAQRHTVRLYATHGAIPWFVPYDTALFSAAPLLDRYTLAGGEVHLKRGDGALLLGTQWVSGVEQATVLMAWPQALLPYRQASSTFLIAPRFGPWRGTTIEARTFLSDEKPFVKSRATITYEAHPAYTQEHIDLSLCFDYWSARDPVTFADRSDWNGPIYDLSLECTVQASTFRFFAKVDNLLNRKLAYVPGFFSPGLTFRWGFGWYLQK